jgi:hypothetical protein
MFCNFSVSPTDSDNSGSVERHLLCCGIIKTRRRSHLLVRQRKFSPRRRSDRWVAVWLHTFSIAEAIVESVKGTSRNSLNVPSSFGLENREYGRRDPLHWPRDTLYPLKLALTSATSCGLSDGIVRSRTKATEFVCCTLQSCFLPFLPPPLHSWAGLLVPCCSSPGKPVGTLGWQSGETDVPLLAGENLIT